MPDPEAFALIKEGASRGNAAYANYIYRPSFVKKIGWGSGAVQSDDMAGITL